MKYTRVEIKNRFNNYKIIICFVLLLPIVAFVIGKVIIGYYENGVNKKGIEVEGFNKVYYLQLGVYEKEKGAKDKIEVLKTKNINSIILKEGNQYKVVSCISSSDKKLKERKKEIENKNIPTYIKSMEIKVPKDKNIKEYSDVIKQYVLASLNGKKSLMESSYESIKEYKKSKESKIKNQDEINNLIKSNIEVNYEKDEEKYYKTIMQIILAYNNIV